ncbi:MAG: DegQ family serine endoprotease [Gammaproteobacteria bacterium]|nr:MAG: DegQ family serine endoprotease [Gammaproteobacteria bacterium]
MKRFQHWIGMVALLWVFPALAELPDFTKIFEDNRAAVVNISTTQIVKRKPLWHEFEMPELPEDFPFREWFKRFFEEQQDQELETQSLGSGFIISSDGYILTNHHVVNDAEEIIVKLSDRRELEAKIVGQDKLSDVALLKVEAKDLQTVKIGRSDNLKVGQWVLAIGSPFGFDHSATQGIISALRRSLPNENYVPYIQTDAAINPGNSGGPLFNMDGEVIGVNAQIYSRTGGFMGLSFAIPIDIAMDVAKQLKAKGHVTRGWLGVLIQDVSRQLAESFGLERPVGALVAKVLPDSPAEKAGLQVGDIIVEYNGHPIERSADLPPLVGRTPVGEVATLKVLRQGKAITLKVTIGKLPEEEKLALAKGPLGIIEKRLAILVTDITPEQKDELGVTSGVLVKEVKKGPAKEAGIRPGDVILRIDNKPVKDVEHFARLVKRLPKGKWVPLLVQRNGSPMFLAIRIPEK